MCIGWLVYHCKGSWYKIKLTQQLTLQFTYSYLHDIFISEIRLYFFKQQIPSILPSCSLALSCFPLNKNKNDFMSIGTCSWVITMNQGQCTDLEKRKHFLCVPKH